MPSFTFAATAEVVALAKAEPVFVDVDPDTYNIDIASLEAAIEMIKREGRLTPKAIIPVDLFGLSADYDAIEKKVRERIKTKLLPDAKVDMIFERRRPPLEATAASRALAKHAQQVYRELGKDLVVDDVAEGGGTDAAFAALDTKAPVIERLGLQGFGAHSIEAEYVLVSSIEPRLYLLTRLIMDLAEGKAE